jgi:DNA-binding HxlR family transcriptional regulator
MPDFIREEVERCPVFIASQVLGKKWAILVLQELMTPEAQNGLRFNQIQGDLDWITPKVLTQRLRDLMAEDILQRTVDSSTIPPKVWYKLTEKGEGLRDTILSMQKWGRKFGGEITAACIRTNFEGCKACRSTHTNS